MPGSFEYGDRRGRLHENLVQSLALGPRFGERAIARQFGLAQFVDVGARTEPAGDVAIGVADRSCPRKEPAVATVTAAKRKRILPRQTGLHAAVNARQHAIDVLGVEE